MRSPVFIARYLVPKLGNRLEQCEDAVVVLPESEPADAVNEEIVAVLCDGASESLLARDWAGILAQGLAERQTGQGTGWIASAVADVAGTWDSWLEEYVRGREAAGRPMAWYERPGLERGAYATLLRVALEPPATRAHGDDELMRLAEAVTADERPGWRWHAAALGDTCLFHVRDDRLLCAFPIRESAEFGTNPSLAGSRNTDESVLGKHIAVAGGWCESGDQLYLATDALSAWFLRGAEDGGSPWNALRDFAGQDAREFDSFIAAERATGALRNDDVAFVHIDIG